MLVPDPPQEPGACAPVWPREYATAAARTPAPRAAHGRSRLIAVANANADAEWPEGNEVESGIRTCRTPGTPAPARSGRARRPSGLMARFTSAEVAPMASVPRPAARRPAGLPVTAITAARASQIRD